MAHQLPDGPVTIVFSDVVGSTDLRTERGDATAHRQLREHEEIVRRCVAAHDGREVKALGDGFMLAFTSVRRALECAIAIQQASAERNSESPGEEVHVRIGVNTGEVVVENGDLFGQAVNAAARIAAAAQAGEVLVSEIVRQLAGSGSAFVFVDRGEVGLKGFPEPWRLYGLAHQATRPAFGGALGARTPFVGRQAERVELRRVLAQVQSGTGALVMIGGEPGVGKTRLAEELARRCEREGFLIYTGHCYESVGAAPYIPIVEAFEQALARAPSPAAFRAFLGESAPDVARLVPRLRALCPEIAPPLELPAEQERRYLFNSLWDVLARTARIKPTLLVLDDIHWADEPTMLLLQHFAERVAEVPLLVVALYRDTELDAGRPLSAVFGELTRRRLALRLPLRRLPADSVREMLTALAGQEPPQELVDVIYAETEGNAFFTEEVFKHLSEERRLFTADGRFRTDLNPAELDVPEGVRLVVNARLQRLAADAQKMLGSAAVLGRVFSFDLLRRLEQESEDRLLDHVEDAERTGVLCSVPGSVESQFMFAHELIRQTVLAQLSGPRRSRLHARAAEAIEQHYAEALEPNAAAIAHHLIQAGTAADPKRTVHFLLMAGAFAQDSAAFEEALAHLERANEYVSATTSTQRAELLFRLGTARRATGRWTEAIESWCAAADTCEAIGDVARAASILNEASYSLIWAARWQEGAALAQRALDLLGDTTGPVRARLLAQQHVILGYADGVPFETSDALGRAAMAMADDLGDPALRGWCLRCRTMSSLCWGLMDAAAAAGMEAADLLHATGNPWEEASALGFTQQALMFLGRFDDCAELHRRVEPLAERFGNVPALLQTRRVMGIRALAGTGDLDAFEQHVRADTQLCEEHGLPWVCNSYTMAGNLHFWRGDWDAAGELYEAAERIEPPGGVKGWDRALLIEFHGYRGDRAAVLDMLDGPGDNRMPVVPGHNQWGRWTMLFSAVEALVLVGERDRAAALHGAVLFCLADSGAVTPSQVDARLASRVAGISAFAAGRLDESEQHFRTALDQAERLPHIPERAHTLRWYVRMLLERDAPGDREAAAGHAAEAADLYRPMGMPRHLAMVEDTR